MKSAKPSPRISRGSSVRIARRLYTDGAVLWTEGWLRGRKDALSELGRSERDGKIKLRCESCGGLAMSNAFLSPAVRTDDN